MRDGIESERMAKHHRQQAAGLEHELDRSIYSDDDDAVEALEVRIAANEARSAYMKRVNGAFKRAKGDPERLAELAGISIPLASEMIDELTGPGAYHTRPYPSFALTNIRARIRADQKRIGLVTMQARHQREAEEAEGGIAIEDRGSGYIAIRFAEKPPRDVINALKTSGFHWSAGRWHGERANLPPGILDEEATEEATDE